MTLAGCVKATADELGLSEREVREIADSLEGAKKRLAAAGAADLTGRLGQFAKSEADKVRIAAALRKKQAALTVLAKDTFLRDIASMRAQGKSADQAIVAKLVGSVDNVTGSRKSISARRAALESDWLGGLLEDIQAQLPQVMKLLRNPKKAKALLDDTVKEMFELKADGKPGLTNNSDARKLAGILSGYLEASRIELNKAGANIGKLDGYAPQSHDAVKLLNVGQREWRQRILPGLDILRSFGNVSAEQLDDILDNIYLNITTGVDRTVKPGAAEGRVGPRNLATSLEKHRVLHFKDAAAYIAYNDQFGRGHLMQGVIRQLRGAARKASLMQTLGPNPEAALTSIIDTLRGNLRQGAATAALPQRGRVGTAVRRLREKLGKAPLRPEGQAAIELDRLPVNLSRRDTLVGKALAEVMGETNIPGNVTGSRIFQSVRNIQSMAKLGGALISSITDLVTYAHAARYQGQNIFQGYASAFAALKPGRTAEDQVRLARQVGVGYESIIGDMLEGFAEDSLPGTLSRLQQSFFKLNGLQWWTDRLTDSYARMASNWMHEQSGRAFGELDASYRNVLGIHGIDETRWEIVRKAITTDPDGNGYITPDALEDLDDGLFAPLAARRSADIRLEAADRWAQLRQQNRRDEEYIAKRRARFDAKFAKARLRLAERQDREAARLAQKRAPLVERFDRIGERLTDLAILAKQSDVDERGIGRREGELGQRAKAIIDSYGEVREAAEKAGVELGDEFEALWRDRGDALDGAKPERVAKFVERFDAARGRLEEKFKAIDARRDSRLEGLDQRLEKITDRLGELDDQASATVNRRDLGREEGRLGRRLEEIEKAMRAADKEFEGLRDELDDSFIADWKGRQDELVAFIDNARERQRLRDELLAKIPADVEARIGRAIDQEKRNLSLDLRSYFSDEASFAVLKADDRTRVTTLQGTRSGTIPGEAFRLIGQFKTFPIAYAQKILGRQLRGAPDGKFDVAGTAELVAASILFGYAAMTAKDALKNRTPRDPLRYETFMAALIQGGGAGIYGDFLFARRDRFGGGIAGDLAGPVLGVGVSAAELWQDIAHGEAKAGDAFYLLLNNIPYLNLFYIRQALDLAILGQIQEWISPGTLKRREERARKDFGSEPIFAR